MIYDIEMSFKYLTIPKFLGYNSELYSIIFRRNF